MARQQTDGQATGTAGPVHQPAVPPLPMPGPDAAEPARSGVANPQTLPPSLRLRSLATLSSLKPRLAGPDEPPDRLREKHANGEISETKFLRDLARTTAFQSVPLHLLPPDPALSDLLDPAFCLRHECVPWRRFGRVLWVATSRPEALDAVRAELDRSEPGDIGKVTAVIAPREQIQDYVARQFRSGLSERMLNRVAPHLSFRTWNSDHRKRLLKLSALTACLGCITALAPLQVQAVLVIWACMTLAIAGTLKISAAAAHLLRPEQDQFDPAKIKSDRLPRFSILVPLYRETEIAEVLIKRLSRLIYPPSRLEVILVLEESDSVTRRVVRRTDLPAWMRVVIVPDGTPRTKPRAMNYALDFCTGDIVGVYDAEDAPDPDQLLRVADCFDRADEDVACVQGALDYYNARDNWMSRCFAIEYNTWFRLLLPGMAKLGFALPLGGTTLFMRRDRLEELGGWDAHNVTEDADLGFRLARAGYRTLVLDTTTGEEANNRPYPWIKQRSRWLKGYLVTYLVHMRQPVQLLRDLGPWQFLGFQAHFVTALSQFAFAPMLWTFWPIAFGMSHPFNNVVPDPVLGFMILMMISVELLSMILGVIATRRPSHRHLWLWVPSLHVYWPLGCFAMWKALYELIFDPFFWDKTSHGHSLKARGYGTLSHPMDAVPPESSFSRVTKALDM
ncbi:glycosyltransferase [Pseudooceanicola sp. C21-150M6]|uniref:glycosyltransferase n=1 Tax=Pseudooceanicola sp. C21-150M6 TaxID=3434355 RepID=UPI003D7FE728